MIKSFVTSQSMILLRDRINSIPGWSMTILLLAVLAWLASLIIMADHDHGPGTQLHEFPIFLGGWALMLTAMMLPTEMTYISTLSALLKAQNRTNSARIQTVIYFVGGYALAWIGYGLIAYLLDAMIRNFVLDAIAWYRPVPLLPGLRIGPLLAGSVLVFAGLYQISKFKQVCLIHCRSPLTFFARNWQQGIFGATRMGLQHGLICVGCCWALMAVMFAVGAMNLIWMALLTLIMFAEKVLPHGRKLEVPIAGFLCSMGAWVVISPDTAPLLKAPLIFGSSICRGF